MTNHEDLVRRYFKLAPAADPEPYFAQFAPDAVVEDEGLTYRGVDAIRSWRAAVPKVSYDVRGVDTVADEHVARAEIAGEFPGSPVTLTFLFTFTEDGRVATLAIRS
ncbi:nuclear transport factor 2 family protein [Mycobacterium hodleri]|uniref:nuclear transport factor 2 family protein n=1 Tax=Mycolicibacterium hodleri TaxID=49897 RepID=UPI0021F3B387|nr:nuclear transport factor 2 family protein [Mycolicibacterium hodleri]MCV7137244.1 nuclear transport factor 2 family protein [Mycolicibacterium hodleri]